MLNEFTWDLEGFTLAEGYDAASGTYLVLAVPHENSFGQITDTTVLVAPAAARAQRAKERPATTVVVMAPGIDVVVDLNDSGNDGVAIATPQHPAVEQPALTTRFFGVVKVNPERYGRDMGRVAQEILEHLAAAAETELEVTIEVTAVSPEGFTPETIRTVTENAKTLKFDQFGCEEG